jgi:serine/threonine protein kinase
MTESDPPILSDSLYRHRLPYPIATMFARRLGSLEAADRVRRTYLFAEGTFRFLAYIFLAEAIVYRPPKKILKKWFKLLQTPGQGKLLSLASECAEFCGEYGDEWLAPLLCLFPRDTIWRQAADDLIPNRNRDVHDRGLVFSEPEAEDRLKDLTPALNEVLLGLRPLCHYDLGVVKKSEVSTDGTGCVEYFSSTGQQMFAEPTIGHTVCPLPSNIVVLTDDTGKGISLSPLLQLLSPSGATSLGNVLMWLLHYGAENGGADYQKAVFVVPSEPQHQSASDVSKWIVPEDPSNWIGRVCIDTQREPSNFNLSHHDTVPGYEILGWLGSGGMGVVYEARQRSVDRLVALKILQHDLNPDRKARERFVREARALGNYPCEGTVGILDAGETSAGLLWMAQELVVGEDLGQRINRDGPLDVKNAFSIVVETLRVLAVLHDKGLVHRDIKPSNIMLSSQGIRIIDFGLAAPLHSTRITASIGAVGTPLYMAPERMGKPSEAISASADVFSVGVMICALVEGKPPSYHEPTTELISPRLRLVIDRARSMDPTNRYADAREMLIAFNKLPTQSVSGPMITTLYKSSENLLTIGSDDGTVVLIDDKGDHLCKTKLSESIRSAWCVDRSVPENNLLAGKGSNFKNEFYVSGIESANYFGHEFGSTWNSYVSSSIKKLVSHIVCWRESTIAPFLEESENHSPFIGVNAIWSREEAHHDGMSDCIVVRDIRTGDTLRRLDIGVRRESYHYCGRPDDDILMLLCDKELPKERLRKSKGIVSDGQTVWFPGLIENRGRSINPLFPWGNLTVVGLDCRNGGRELPLQGTTRFIGDIIASYRKDLVIALTAKWHEVEERETDFKGTWSDTIDREHPSFKETDEVDSELFLTVWNRTTRQLRVQHPTEVTYPACLSFTGNRMVAIGGTGKIEWRDSITFRKMGVTLLKPHEQVTKMVSWGDGVLAAIGDQLRFVLFASTEMTQTV